MRRDVLCCGRLVLRRAVLGQRGHVLQRSDLCRGFAVLRERRDCRLLPTWPDLLRNRHPRML